jgi:hypothetical protein
MVTKRLFSSILFSSLLFCSRLFCSVLFYSIPFYPILFYSILFSSLLLCSVLYYCLLFCCFLFYSFLFYSVLFYSILTQLSSNTGISVWLIVWITSCWIMSAMSVQNCVPLLVTPTEVRHYVFKRHEGFCQCRSCMFCITFCSGRLTAIKPWPCRSHRLFPARPTPWFSMPHAF